MNKIAAYGIFGFGALVAGWIMYLFYWPITLKFPNATLNASCEFSDVAKAKKGQFCNISTVTNDGKSNTLSCEQGTWTDDAGKNPVCVYSGYPWGKIAMYFGSVLLVGLSIHYYFKAIKS